ncbi:MAG: ABC transporter permease, partial [Peptostreptococcus sp.]|nr:ABC transporter permease [Peptostreptococcus sp.]
VLESKGISSSRDKYEFDCIITGIDSLRQEELKDKGILSSEDIKIMGQENQVYAVTNNFYYDGQTNKYQKFLKSLKDGQIVYIKLPCIEDGLQTYKLLPVKLIPNKKPKATIEERTASNSSTIEIMFDLNRLKSLTNTSTVSAIRFDVTSSDEANLVKSRLSSRFEVKDRDRERLNKKELRDKTYFDKIKFRLSFYSILLLFSLVFTIRIITDKKTRDVGVLRMLGADKRLINKTLFVENMIFVVTSLVIGVSIGLYRVYKYYKITRDQDLYYKGIAHVEFHPPYATIIVLIVLVFIISILMQMYSNKRLVSKDIMLDTRSE